MNIPNRQIPEQTAITAVLTELDAQLEQRQAKTRAQIVEALRASGRRVLDSKSSSINYLDHWDLKAVGF